LFVDAIPLFQKGFLADTILAPVADQHGVAHLALPPGFAYRSFSATGSPMGDGSLTPQHHDGMRAFPGPGNTVRLIRNHEITASRGTTEVPFPVTGPADADPESSPYDPVAKGGTVTIDYDPATGQIRDFVSLTGTIYNCAGGATGEAGPQPRQGQVE
jgi:secreted PhoX family phosphatase